jgi:DNA-directed RNA polymerase specialized sigma24 family protein
MALVDNRVLDRHIVQRTADRAAAAGDAADELLRRAELLLEPDRSILQLALRHGLTRMHIGRLHHLSAGQICRRLRRIGARLNDPLVVRLLSPVCPLRPEYRQIGLEHFLQAIAFRDIAARHAMPLSQVRRVCQDLRAWEGRSICIPGHPAQRAAAHILPRIGPRLVGQLV